MNWREKVKKKLEGHPNLKFEENEEFIKVFPQDDKGFFVSIGQDEYDKEDNEITVEYGEAWHNHYESEDEAINWFLFGLSNQCRLKVGYCGDKIYKGVVERQTSDGDWERENTSGQIFFPFWKRKRFEYLSNDLIPFEGPLR